MATTSFSDRNGSNRGRRIWRFGNACFDESSWTVTVHGLPTQLETKPLAVLHELLKRYGEVITKDELLDAVWCDQREPAAEGSLTTAVFKLRKALDEQAAQQIRTVSKVGYRLTGPVTFEQVRDPMSPLLLWAAGAPVPRRPGWVLIELLPGSSSTPAWRAQNTNSAETRIFRCTDTAEGLQSFHREVAISRQIAEAKINPSPVVDLLEWSFEEPPFFIETADPGPDLKRWAEERGGLSEVPLVERIALMRSAARQLATIHTTGIIHGDVSPETIIVRPELSPAFIRIGVGVWPAEEAVVDGDTPVDNSRGGSEAKSSSYAAPEVRSGGQPSTATDIYSLGVLLYQVIVGDFTARLAPGWEDEVGDPLLVDDVAQSAATDPAKRLHSASQIAERLGNLAERRSRAEEERTAAAKVSASAEAERRRLARAPWVRAAAALLITGFATTSIALVAMIHARDVAEEERRAATAAYDFLSDDVLARVSPARADAADETLTEAVLRARSELDRRFAHQPQLAGRLHATLARAFTQRSQWDEARRSYMMADAAFRRAGVMAEADAVENRMTLAVSEAASAQPGAATRAKSLIAAEVARNSDALKGAAGVKLAQAQGLLAYFNDPQAAPRHFDRAVALARALPTDFSSVERLQLRQAAAMARLRLGEARAAAIDLHDVAEQIALIEGESHPDALLAQGSALTAAVLSGQYRQASDGATRLLPLLEHRFGPDHRFTLAILALRSQALGAQGQVRQAIHDAERVWQSASAKEAEGQQAQVGQLDLAQLLCRGGRSEEGARHARAAHGSVDSANGSTHPLAHVASFILGECIAAEGDTAGALSLYRTVDPAAVGMQVGDGNWAANLHLARAEAYLARGELDQARQALREVGNSFDSATADAIQRGRTQKVRTALAGTS